MKQGIDGICKKVDENLVRSNALIAECSTSSPNVMFEIGYARAMRYPMVILMNSEAFDDPELEDYFEFLGLHGDKPLPADLGDVEFLLYSQDITTPGGKEEFKQRLRNSLDLIRKALPPGIQILQEGRKKLDDRISLLNKDNHELSDPPLLRLLGGWLNQIMGELDIDGNSGFLVHSNYYRSCFKLFSDNERHRAVAIADHSDSVEDSWVRSPNQTQMSVGERIFMVSGEEFFSDSRLEELFHGIQQHIEQADNESYQVRIAWSEHPGLPNKSIFANSTGRDLLVIDPDLVGGYETIEGTPFLRIVQSSNLHIEATKFYQEVRKRSFKFDKGMTSVSDLRAKWFAKDGIGEWGDNWSFDFRDNQYYNFYDWHIRSWVPEYDQFIEHTGNKVIEALWNQRGQNQKTGAVLEIGCGTGALSSSLFNKIYLDDRSRSEELCRKLVFIDKSQEMLDRAKKTVWKPETASFVKFERATAFDGLPASITQHAPFSIICSSLVLSHILQDKIEINFKKMLNDCAELLTPNGVLVFADALVPNPEMKEKSEAWWKTWMKQNGLAPNAVDLFIEKNQEMLETITKKQLDLICPAHGFLRPNIHLVPGSTENSPFRILTIRRCNE